MNDEKNIYIFINNQSSQKQQQTQTFEEYINRTFKDYVLLLTEEREPISNEEEDRYFIVEY